MTQRILPALTLSLFLALGLGLNAHAQESKRIPAPSQQELKDASDAAYAKNKPEKSTPGAKRDEANMSDEPTATTDDAAPAESAVVPFTTEEMDALTAYDPSKVRGLAHPWQMYYQPAASPVMEKLEWLHNYVMVIITVITIIVTVLLAYVCIRFRAKKNPVPHRFAHNTTVEILWTVIPILILVAIGIPSVRAHYQYTDNENIINNPDLTLKVTGHQWYWSYEYPDYGIAYDSNIVPAKDTPKDQPRLLMVDNPVVVPVNKVVRIQMTSADVIHAWAMPAMGVKQDVVPGRLNETWFKAEKEGIYFGQCSELCGKFHGFMPIQLIVVSDEDFARWAAGAKLKFAADGSRQFAALTQ